MPSLPKLKAGDLVTHVSQTWVLGTVIMTAITIAGHSVCEVVVIRDRLDPENVGKVKYLNRCYWTLVEDSKKNKTNLD